MPHDMTEEAFMDAIEASAAEAGLGQRGGQEWDVVYFAPGKMSKKQGRVSEASRKGHAPEKRPLLTLLG